MKKGTIFSIIALLIALAGAAVAVAVYLKRQGCDCEEYDMDDFDDEIDDGAYCVSPCTEEDDGYTPEETIVLDSDEEMQPIEEEAIPE